MIYSAIMALKLFELATSSSTDSNNYQIQYGLGTAMEES